MSFLTRLLGRDTDPAALCCPHCEREMLEGHDVEACARRRMSRRHFFGILGGTAVAVAGAKILPATGKLFDPVTNIALDYAKGSFPRSGNTFLTIDQITNEMLSVLQKNLVIGREVTRKWEDQFPAGGLKIGDTIQVRKPIKYVGKLDIPDSLIDWDNVPVRILS